MTDTLLQTKLFVPNLGGGRLARAALAARLDRALLPGCCLALISAPAGFGKTTLASQWAHRLLDGQPGERVRVGWLSLDAQDNAVDRFWTYLAAAMAAIQPGLSETIVPRLRSAPLAELEDPARLDEILTQMLNLLANTGGPAVVVLDDYHVITNRSIQTGLLFVLEHLPPDLHLMIATRSDPPLPLHRLRARGQMVELRTSDLRFQLEESMDFFRSVMGLKVEEDDAAVLEQRTEGWPAGLQMAGLAVGSQLSASGQAPGAAGGQGEAAKPVIKEFIERFSGTNRYVLDYLSEEVLESQPEDVRRFLLKTAILDRLCAGLCDAVTGCPEGQNSQAMLDRLERDNLFLVPLDGERRWFRYHHLFGDILRAELNRRLPGEAAGLHQRASAWYEAQAGDGITTLAEETAQAAGEYLSAAVRHAVAGGKPERAAELVEKYWQAMTHSGSINTPVHWLDLIPPGLIASRPMLGIARAWLSFLQGKTSQILDDLSPAVQVLAQLQAAGRTDPADDEYRTLAVHITSLRSVHARHQREYDQAIALAHQAQALGSSDDHLLFGITWLNIASASQARGDLQLARDAYEKVIPFMKAARNRVAAGVSLYYLVRILHTLGQLRRAETACRAELEAAGITDENIAQPGARTTGVFEGMACLALASVLFEQGRLELAETYLDAAQLAGERTGYYELLKNSHLTRALLLQALGRWNEAEAELRVTERYARRSEVPVAAAEVDALKARAALRKGDLGTAAAWARGAMDFALAQGLPGMMAFPFEQSMQVRLLAAEGKAQEAAGLAGRLAQAAGEQGRTADQIELLVLESLAQTQAGQGEAAKQALARAVELAAPEGYRQVLLDAGEGFQALAGELLASEDLSPAARAWLETLSDGREAQTQAPARGAPPAAEEAQYELPEDMVYYEALSEREIEVLRLLADGQSNRQIARQLYLALGTVKTHIHNIFNKLGAENRVQAVTRGKALKII